jgi:hypothetical protein
MLIKAKYHIITIQCDMHAGNKILPLWSKSDDFDDLIIGINTQRVTCRQECHQNFNGCFNDKRILLNFKKGLSFKTTNQEFNISSVSLRRWNVSFIECIIQKMELCLS